MKKNKRIILLGVVLISSIFLLTGCKNKENEFKKTKAKYDYLVLVNKYLQLPDDWEKKVELVNTKNAWDEDIKVEKEAYEQYKKLAKALEEENITIKLDSVYRSVSAQQELWDEWSKDPEKGLDYVKKYVAVPGYSEHHTGLALDICLEKDGALIYENEDMIAEKEIFAKIHSKLADYGFILRYLEDRDDITGYAYEPWHLRYVGSEKIAKEIMDKDITFEEYLESITDLVNNQSAAKYKIEKTLQDYFQELYGKKIKNSRFNITKIYTTADAKSNSIVKNLELDKKDIAFEVTYQLQPAKDVKTSELTKNGGKYDKELGWVKDIERVGILKYNEKDKTYSITNFKTEW